MDDRIAKNLTKALEDHSEALKAHAKALEMSNKLTRMILGETARRDAQQERQGSEEKKGDKGGLASGGFVDPMTRYLAERQQP